MRRTLLLLGIVLCFAAIDAGAQCKQCYWEGDCPSCVPTNYNASILCHIEYDWCVLEGGCEGSAGDCNEPYNAVQQFRPLELKLPPREWQLVAVEIQSPARTGVEKRRRS